MGQVGRPPLRAYGIKTKTDLHLEKIYDLLYDYGPHTAEQIANHLGVSSRWVLKMMSLMKADGSTTIIQRGVEKYWILKEDAIAA